MCSIAVLFAAEMQEKVLSELAQNLNTLPPTMRAKGKIDQTKILGKRIHDERIEVSGHSKVMRRTESVLSCAAIIRLDERNKGY